MVLFYFDIIVCVKKINFRMANVIDFIYKKITLKKLYSFKQSSKLKQYD